MKSNHKSFHEKINSHPVSSHCHFNRDNFSPMTTKISAAGVNIWNQAQEPTNWWNRKIKTGATGTSANENVLRGGAIGKLMRARTARIGWHMGTARTGHHLHIPLKTPYSCIATDWWLALATALAGLDIRLGEGHDHSRHSHKRPRRKDGTGPVLLLKPDQKYLEKNPPPA